MNNIKTKIYYDILLMSEKFWANITIFKHNKKLDKPKTLSFTQQSIFSLIYMCVYICEPLCVCVCVKNSRFITW